MPASELKIFVISDLHLGGRPHVTSDTGAPVGSRINSSYRHLTDFLDWLSVEASQGAVELVINGDIIDFLLVDDVSPDPAPWTCDEDAVIRRLNYIVASSRDIGGRGPFDALADFCIKAAEGNASLVLMLGNHDLELSLPKVRRHFLRNVLRSDGRGVRFIYDNEAYCRGDLIIEHGNRYDILNAVDHDCLRRERSALSRGEDLDQSLRQDGRFTPPGGSVLVTELFNPLKETYRFLDLLKPEKKAALPLMLALEPQCSGMIAAIIKLCKVMPRAMPAVRSDGEFVNDRGYIAAGNATATFDLRSLLREAVGSDADSFEVAPETGISAASAWQDIQFVKKKAGQWLLGWDRQVLSGVTRKQLSVALKKLAQDTSFSLDHEIEPYLSEARRLLASGRFSTIVFGHTHLPKQIDIPRPNLPTARYLNTGTWADVMRVPPKITEDGAEVEKEIDNFLESLAANRFQVARYLTYARISMLHSDGKEKVQSAVIRSFCGISNPDLEPLTEAGEA
jgi:UDP-2,3-diacylglucosamine pyrophosphatase LpxH